MIGGLLIVAGVVLLGFALYLAYDVRVWAMDPERHELFTQRVRRWLGWR